MDLTQFADIDQVLLASDRYLHGEEFIQGNHGCPDFPEQRSPSGT